MFLTKIPRSNPQNNIETSGDGFAVARHESISPESLGTERSGVKQSQDNIETSGDGFAVARNNNRNHLPIFIINKQYFIYIMTNKNNTVLYTGVTNNLVRRVYEHKKKLIDGFTKKYNIIKLVYYEIFNEPSSAMQREKQIKGGSRQKKIDLINGFNPYWRDLYEIVCS